MYGQFYGFREKPFSLLPDPDFLFPSRKHQMALNLLEMAIFNQSGFCVISGEIGTGKTTLVRELLNRLDENVCVGLISNTHDSFSELLGWVLSAFDIGPESEEAIYRHHQFTDFVVGQYAAGRHTLLIIDEAQNLSLSAMEQLRMLSNVNSDKDLLLQVILIGQRELREKLQMPALAQFAQRISIDYHLAALDEKETVAYIRHRVARAGGPDDLFDDAACKGVYRHTGGVPRLINRLCDLSLVYGFADQANVIGAELIEAVLRDGRLLPESEASPRSIASLAYPATSKEKVPVEPLARTILPNAAAVAARQSLPATGSNKNRNGVEQPGAQTMNEPSDKEPQEKLTDDTPADATAVASTPVAREGTTEKPDMQAEAPALEALQSEAEKVLAEKTRAEQLSAEKASAARDAIAKAASELATARSAVSEKLAAEKQAAETIIADRKAAKRLARARAAAESAASERQAAEQAVVAHDTTAGQALEKIDEEKLASDDLVFDKISAEKTAMEEAAAAKAAAEQALAERIAAEKAAAEIAAAADSAVSKALVERVAAEKAAAERVVAAEHAAEQAKAEQAEARRTAAEKLAAEKAASSQAETDTALARQAAAARAAAKDAELRLIAAAERATESANATRAAAEKAVAEHMAASRAAVEKVTAEKVALAKVAAGVAAAAKQAAEQAEAAKVAALRDASEKEAAAVEAAHKAAEAEVAAREAAKTESGDSAEIVDLPRPVEAEKKPHPLDHLLLAGAAHAAGEKQPARQTERRPKTWAVMTIAAVAAGAAVLAGKWGGFDLSTESRVAARKPLTETASVAAMQVKKTEPRTDRKP